MTTLIIHPNPALQRKKAISMASKFIGKEIKDLKTLGQSPDIQILNGTQVSSIGIDDIRKFKKKLQFQPYESDNQVGLIIHAQALSMEAQNSLLKILEEPGDQTQFILTVANERSLLPTILSRANKLYLQEDQKITGTTVFDNLDEDLLSKLEIKTFLHSPVEEKFQIIDEMVEADKDNPELINFFTKELLNHYRQKLKAILKKDPASSDSCIQSIENISKSADYMSHNVNKKLALENLILQLEESIM
jgi:hypothetical protein